ncbi:MAG: LacI family DNA-binding transcriptional regulator [Brevefilum sp.]
MSVTIKDVAEKAGCSIKTVSRVVNDEPHVTEETRNKVQEAIDTLGYAPNFSARRLVQRRSYMICVLLHEAGFYQAEVLSKVMDIGYQHDYDILIQSYYPSHSRSKEKLQSLINERRVDGLVITPPCDVDRFLSDLLARSQVPYVQITPLNRTADVPYVTGDDYQGAYLMTERLILMGHWRIAFLKGPRNHRTSLDRLYGYKAALEMYRIPFDEQLVGDSLYNFDGGYNAARILMDLDQPPTAIFGGSDQAAIGALYALRELKVEIPKQVSVAGFDNLPQSNQVWPGLSTVEHPVEMIVARAIEMLTTILAGKEPISKQIVLPCQLVMRGSTGAPPPENV